MPRIDLRSDTVTLPTREMREAMAGAELGDDVYGEDPTVNRLEAIAAERLGKEAGLFVASGSMGNLVAILSHARRGDEAIVGIDGHSYVWEAGGMATLGGIVPHPLPTAIDGRLAVEDIEASIRPDDPHLPRSRLLLLENSYGARNGAPLPADYFRSLATVAARHHLRTHLDGARLFNAAIALQVEPASLAADVDSVSFCLSKGLCAPVGSVLCGSAPFIHEARRQRKAVGGGMRQAGVLAAAGLVALDRMVDRLADDHRRARVLAESLASLPGIRLVLETVRTNIVFFDLSPDLDLEPRVLIERLEQDDGVLIDTYLPNGPRTLRAVTHHGIDDEAVKRFLRATGRILSAAGRRDT
ncbi:MAG: low-specificity L-threonine aldolase [Acidobacteriota bacterium]